jgi:hypothetical protein
MRSGPGVARTDRQTDRDAQMDGRTGRETEMGRASGSKKSFRLRTGSRMTGVHPQADVIPGSMTFVSQTNSNL